MSNQSSAKGMSYSEAVKKILKTKSKIVFGSKTELWHVIDADDRDYNTRFSLSYDQAAKKTGLKL